MPIDFRCPHCGTTFRVKDDLAGAEAECFQCKAMIHIPDAQPAAAAPPHSASPASADPLGASDWGSSDSLESSDSLGAGNSLGGDSLGVSPLGGDPLGASDPLGVDAYQASPALGTPRRRAQGYLGTGFTQQQFFMMCGAGVLAVVVLLTTVIMSIVGGDTSSEIAAVEVEPVAQAAEEPASKSAEGTISEPVAPAIGQSSPPLPSVPVTSTQSESVPATTPVSSTSDDDRRSLANAIASETEAHELEQQEQPYEVPQAAPVAESQPEPTAETQELPPATAMDEEELARLKDGIDFEVGWAQGKRRAIQQGTLMVGFLVEPNNDACVEKMHKLIRGEKARALLKEFVPTLIDRTYDRGIPRGLQQRLPDQLPIVLFVAGSRVVAGTGELTSTYFINQLRNAKQATTVVTAWEWPDTGTKSNAPMPDDGRELYARKLLNKRPPTLYVHEWINKKPELHGKWVLLEFYATACPGCMQTVPHLNKLANTFSKRLVVVGLSSEKAETVRSRLLNQAKYPLAIDPIGRTSSAVEVNGIPHALLIDPSGTVRWQGIPLSGQYSLTPEVLQDIMEKYDTIGPG